jgi:hypothetical protein
VEHDFRGRNIKRTSGYAGWFTGKPEKVPRRRLDVLIVDTRQTINHPLPDPRAGWTVNTEVGHLLMPPSGRQDFQPPQHGVGVSLGAHQCSQPPSKQLEKNQGSQPFIASARFVSILQEPIPVHLDLGLGIWLVWSQNSTCWMTPILRRLVMNAWDGGLVPLAVP